MHRISSLILVLLVAACSFDSTEPTTATTPVSPATTTTSPTTTAASVVVDELTTTSCPTDDSDFTLICEAYDIIRRNYVDPVDDSTLAEAGVEGLRTLMPTGTQPGPLTCAVPADAFVRVCEQLERTDVAGEGVEAILFGITEYGLDRNSSYITPRALALLTEEQSGRVEGIGALVTTEDLTSDDPENTPCSILSSTCPLVIVSTLPGSPAAAAGVEAGDIFVAVDGLPVDGLSIDEVTATVRGPAGTDVTITFSRDGTEVEITITRESIQIPVTQSEIVGDVGYLRLNFFSGTAGSQLESDLRALLGAGVSTIVLDLRDNPGGTLDAALDVASEFLDGGVVVKTVGPDEERSYPVRGDGIATDPSLELVVLVNRGSASASEVVAGALQERGRAVIVGETTFGKNTVQQRFGLSNGGALKLTIARWLTAGGHDLDKGVIPDRTVEIDASLSPAEIVPLVVG